ncbi:hypothetical protein KIPB_000139 [Kipferlia bialata]|uniref:Uncharacterized protein n=1 Tax=Kipferlia bialata TaxID=797122 RepID=A0A9K3CN44_9EUKA|nr:hypothetical protein KIPB_000139 [Kipferlia bialata]|eukprot:g139.t1
MDPAYIDFLAQWHPPYTIGYEGEIPGASVPPCLTLDSRMRVDGVIAREGKGDDVQQMVAASPTSVYMVVESNSRSWRRRYRLVHLTLLEDDGPDMEREDIKFKCLISDGPFGGVVEGWDSRKMRGIAEEIPLPRWRPKDSWNACPCIAVWNGYLMCLFDYKLYFTCMDFIGWGVLSLQPWGTGEDNAHLELFVVDDCLLVVQIGGTGRIYVIQEGGDVSQTHFSLTDPDATLEARPCVGVCGNTMHYVYNNGHWGFTPAQDGTSNATDFYQKLRESCSSRGGGSVLEMGRYLVLPNSTLVDTVSGDSTEYDDSGLFEQCGRDVPCLSSQMCSLTDSTALFAKSLCAEDLAGQDIPKWGLHILRLDRPRPPDFYEHLHAIFRAERRAQGLNY